MSNALSSTAFGMRNGCCGLEPDFGMKKKDKGGLMEKQVLFETRHTFTQDELRKLGADLANANASVYELRSEKDVETKRLAAAIKAAEDTAANITHKIREGWELREIPCLVKLDTPRRGMAEIVSMETGEVLDTRPMKDDEMQSFFRFQSTEGPAQ